MMLPCAGWPSRPCTIAVRQFSSCCSRPLSETHQCTTEQGVKGSSPLDKFLEIKRCFLVDWYGRPSAAAPRFSRAVLRLPDHSSLSPKMSRICRNPMPQYRLQQVCYRLAIASEGRQVLGGCTAGDARVAVA